MDEPLITIGVTCFNAQETIRRALDSAFAQDWEHREIVVVDDASTDDTAEIVETAFAQRQDARLIRHECNTGAAGARNTLLREASGEFVVFFDDDDESVPGRIRVQVQKILSYERSTGATLIACYASGTRLYPNGYRVALPAIGSRGDEAPHGTGVADYLLLFRRRPGWFYGAGTPTCALMARRSAFLAAGGFDPELRRVEDLDFAIALALMGGHFIGTPEPLFVQHATWGQDKSPERNLDGEQRLAQKNRDYLGRIERYYYALHWPRLRYWHFRRRYDRLALELLGLLMRNPLEVTQHLMATGPRRLLHERRMRRKGAAE